MTRWWFNANVISIADAGHVRRVLDMASEDGWELVTIVASGTDESGKPQATVIWRRDRPLPAN
jgi:hypothetical protein